MSVEPKVYISTRKGLKIHIRPETKEWDPDRRKDKVIPGVFAKFQNGRYVATTEEEIDFLDKFFKDFPDEGFPIIKENERLVKAINKVKQEEEELKAQKTKGQGAMGTTTGFGSRISKKRAGQGVIN